MTFSGSSSLESKWENRDDEFFVPLLVSDYTQLSGRRSLWDLLTRCIDLLELDLNISDWMDLYADGMSESLSPRRQVYVDMDRLYYVYEDPTYRYALELCLCPFAGQIFHECRHNKQLQRLCGNSYPHRCTSILILKWPVFEDRCF